MYNINEKNTCNISRLLPTARFVTGYGIMDSVLANN